MKLRNNFAVLQIVIYTKIKYLNPCLFTFLVNVKRHDSRMSKIDDISTLNITLYSIGHDICKMKNVNRYTIILRKFLRSCYGLSVVVFASAEVEVR